MTIREQCRLIYKEAFEDEDDSFENALFHNCYQYCRVLEKGGEAVSMLFALPCEIVTEKGALNAAYIYAAATHKLKRSKGYMSELIEKVKRENFDVLFLRPADEDLIKFYEKLSFEVIKTDNKERKVPFVNPKEGFSKLLAQKQFEDTKDFTLM